MVNITSAIDKTIRIIMTMRAQDYFFRQLIPEIIRLYGDQSVSRHRANNIFKLPPLVSLVAIKIKLLHGDLRVSRPHTNSFKTVSKGYMKFKVFRDLALTICLVS